MCKEDKQKFEPMLLRRRRRLKSQQDVHLGIILPRFLHRVSSFFPPLHGFQGLSSSQQTYTESTFSHWSIPVNYKRNGGKCDLLQTLTQYWQVVLSISTILIFDFCNTMHLLCIDLSFPDGLSALYRLLVMYQFKLSLPSKNTTSTILRRKTEASQLKASSL